MIMSSTQLRFESQINLKSDKVLKHFDIFTFLADLGLLVQTER